MVMTDEMGNYRALSLPVGSPRRSSGEPDSRCRAAPEFNLRSRQERVVNLKLEVGELTGSERARNCPFSSVMTMRVAPVSTFFTATIAPPNRSARGVLHFSRYGRRHLGACEVPTRS